MSENLKVFDYKNNKVRTVELDDEPWFVLKDVCGVLGLTDTNRTAERLDSDELTRTTLVSGGQNREMYVINESGLYNVILRSDKPEAKPFRKWVTSEVLPSIRKNGGYIYGQEQFTPQELMAKALLVAQKTLDEREARISKLTAQNRELAEKNEYMAPRADYCDNVLQSTSVTYLSTDIAKEYGWSARKLNKILHELKIIQKVGKNWHLYSHLDGQGFVEYKETEYYDSIHGETGRSSYLYWTERGKAYIYNRLKKLGFTPRKEASRKVKEA